MNIPNKEKCMELFNYYIVPPQIRNHSIKVYQVAKKVAAALKDAGEDINVELVKAAALVHDLLRTLDFDNFEEFLTTLLPENAAFLKKLKEKYQDLHHADAIALELKDKYPEVAQVAGKHIFYNATKEQENQQFKLEAKIVSYADKRVTHDQITSIKERYEEGMKRWHFPKELIMKEMKVAIELEKEIFKKLSIKPEDINEDNIEE